MNFNLSKNTGLLIAGGSFVYNFASQLYGILSEPSMKDIHDANLSFFSPQPYFIALFFFPQQIFQLIWLATLFRLNSNQPKERNDLETILHYVPFYAAGNACIGTWMFFWVNSHLIISDIFVIINTVLQLYYVYTQLGPMNVRNRSSILTHIIVKTFAGIGVLDLLHNTSAAFFRGDRPTTLTQILTGVGFALLSTCSDWIFGGCLVYDLIALSVGQASYAQRRSWSGMLAAYAVICGAIVTIKNYFRPPYVVHDNDYMPTSQDDIGR